MAETINLKIIPVEGQTAEIGDLIVIACFHPGKSVMHSYSM